METYVTRRPILDATKHVFAFQLLHHPGTNSGSSRPDPDHAARKVISDLVALLDVEAVTGGRKALVPVTRDVLVQELATMLPPHLTILAIPTTVEPDDKVVSACQRLREKGYQLCLDGFRETTRHSPLAEVASVFKVDFQSVRRDEWRDIARFWGTSGKMLIAGNVDHWDEYTLAMHLGYRYAIGGFFSKPVVVVGRDIPASSFRYLQLMLEIYKEETDVDRLEQIVKGDVSLSFKLLQFMNSSHVGMQSEVKSIRHALILMGQSELKRWVSLVALTGMAVDKPQELMVEAILRARLCELMAPHLRLESKEEDLFLVGMLSVLDALLDRPMAEIVAPLPLSDELKTALLDGKNRMGHTVNCVSSYIRGEWDVFPALSLDLGLDPHVMPGLFVEALQWTHGDFEQRVAAA